MNEVLIVEMQMAAWARKHLGEGLTNLHDFIDIGLLHDCFDSQNKEGASGVDAEKWTDYNKERNERIPELLTAFRSGSYHATVQDKVLQTAVSRVLTPIHEGIFYHKSYGFRPGKSQHQAVEELSREVNMNRMRYIIDADMQNYFGSINHGCLREFLGLKIILKNSQIMITQKVLLGEVVYYRY